MPLIQPPPARPKKVTIAIRLEVPLLNELRIYGTFIGTRNNSYIVSESLAHTFKHDTHYRAWLKAHPNVKPEPTPQRNGTSHRKATTVVSDAPASSIVAAAVKANHQEG